MSTPITIFKDLPAEVVAVLRARGIHTRDQFLDACATPAQRREVAQASAVDDRTLLSFANRADLSRVRGVGHLFSALLEEAGVDTVKEMARRRAENLHAAIVEVNRTKKLCKRAPNRAMVQDWVAQARRLPPKLEY